MCSTHAVLLGGIIAYFTEEISNTPGVDDNTRYIMQIKMGW